MKLKVKNQLTVTRIAILGTEKLNNWKSNELDLIALSLGKLRSDLWNEFGSLKAWGVSKFEIDKQLRTLKDKYQLPEFPNSKAVMKKDSMPLLPHELFPSQV